MSKPAYTARPRRVRAIGEAPPAPRDEPLTHTAHGHGGTRIDAAVDARLAALCERMSTSWHNATRSEVLRAVILAGLPIVEADYPPKPTESQKRGPR